MLGLSRVQAVNVKALKDLFSWAYNMEGWICTVPSKCTIIKAIRRGQEIQGVRLLDLDEGARP
jgi:hypothetical protein